MQAARDFECPSQSGILHWHGLRWPATPTLIAGIPTGLTLPFMSGVAAITIATLSIRTMSDRP
jgi:hypothetical protein